MPKNIILCCDGTNNEYGDSNTNVVRLYSLLEKSTVQTTYYDPGVGTVSAPNVWSKIGKATSKVAGLAFGAGIQRDIEQGYTFLMRNYEDGDKVYIYGFSRGAYTARAIAAMIMKCGLLDYGNENLVEYASKIFRQEKRPSIYRGFRKTFSRPCKIEFLGLWDTVKSVGWVYDPLTLQYTVNNPIVRCVRHAISIDEKRNFYRQHLWGKVRPSQDVKQVWFAGVHSDVGGGYAYAENGPANITLDWMIKQSDGVIFDADKTKNLFKSSPPEISRPKIHESLRGGWKIAEYVPKTYKDPNDGWKTKLKIYRGESRFIEANAVIHQSVLDRIKGSNYAPQNLPNTYGVEPW